MGILRLCTFLLLFAIFPRQIFAQSTVSGTVVDQNGGALPLVAVRLVDAAGADVATTFTDSRGAFQFSRACDNCSAVVSLAGFNEARAAASNGSSLRLTLSVAPIGDSVVVTATRVETPASQVGSSLTVFTAEEIARRDSPLVGDLLKAAPGITVVSAGHGSVTSVFTRGGEATYNKVLLDGIPLNEPGGTYNFSNLSTDFVERIEVVRGAQSALFGTDAMASVVQVVTKRMARGAAHPAVLVSAEAGSYDSNRVAASIGAVRGLWDGAVHVGRQGTDNRVPNNEFRNTTIAGNGGVAPSTDIAIRFVGRGELGRTGVPGQTAYGRPDLDAFFRRRDGVGGVTFEQQVSRRWQQRATYALSVSHQRSANLLTDPDYTPRFENRVAPFAFSDFPYDSLSDLRRHYLSYQADTRLGASSVGEQLLTLAFDVNAERAVLTDSLASSVVRAERNNFGWTAQHQWLGARASVSTGLRVERNGSFGTEVAPRVSVAYMASSQTKVKANVGLGVKEPTILQSFSPSPFFLGNPDLEPERSTTFDVGIEQRLLDQRVKLDLVWFDGRFKNIISTKTTSFSPFRSQYFNIGLTKAHGVELGAEAAPGSAVRVRGGYTLVASRIAESTAPSNAVFAVGSWAFRRPRHSGFVEALLTGELVSVDLRGTFIGRRVDSDFSSLVPAVVESEAYGTWDAGLSARISPLLTLFVRVENLANRDYMEPLGYPAWQRTARAGVRFAW